MFKQIKIKFNEKIMSFLSRHKRIRFWAYLIKYGNDAKYIDCVLGIKESPLNLKLEYNETGVSSGIVYTISNGTNQLGFCASIIDTLQYLSYADRLGFFPRVEYDKSFLYAENHFVNSTNNPWEYYFLQPYLIIDGDLAQKATFFSCNAEEKHLDIDEKMIAGMSRLQNYDCPNDVLEYYSKIYSKYIHLNSNMEKMIMDSYSSLELYGRVLGVHHRATDFKKEYKYHPKYISLEQKIMCIREVIADFDCIFFATDSIQDAEKLKREFPKKVFLYEDVYREDGDIGIHFSKSERKNHKFLLGFEVLRDVYTLSFCDALIGGYSKVTQMAQIVKKSRGEDYDYCKIISNGIINNGKYFV